MHPASYWQGEIYQCLCVMPRIESDSLKTLNKFDWLRVEDLYSNSQSVDNLRVLICIQGTNAPDRYFFFFYQKLS